MRIAVLVVLATLAGAAAAATSGRVVAAHGVRLTVPLAWSRVQAAPDGPVTDPRTLLVVGTTGVRAKKTQCQIAAYRVPADGAVVVVVGWRSLKYSGAEKAKPGYAPLKKLLTVRKPSFECFGGRGAAADVVIQGTAYQVNVLVGDRTSKRRVAAALAVGRSFRAIASGTSGRTISTAGATLSVPADWHAAVSRTPTCDPERLIVASTERLRIGAGARVASPTSRGVIVLLLEDRQVQDRPSGDLRLPKHFQIDWHSLRTLEPDGFCGNPKGPAAMHYFKTHGRYLGYIVYPGKNVDERVRRQTLALMDSLQVTP
jgi:hypothetical protein